MLKDLQFALNKAGGSAVHSLTQSKTQKVCSSSSKLLETECCFRITKSICIFFPPCTSALLTQPCNHPIMCVARCPLVLTPHASSLSAQGSTTTLGDRDPASKTRPSRLITQWGWRRQLLLALFFFCLQLPVMCAELHPSLQTCARKDMKESRNSGFSRANRVVRGRRPRCRFKMQNTAAFCGPLAATPRLLLPRRYSRH